MSASFERIFLNDCPQVFTVYSEKGKNEIMNNRRIHGLSFCESGKITYFHKGKKIVSEPGKAVFHPKGATYRIERNKTGIFYVINFNCANDPGNEFEVRGIENNEQLIKTLKKMKEMQLFKENDYGVMSIFYNILNLISEKKQEIPAVLKPAMEFLEKNYAASGLTNTILAEKCNISEVYFRKLFLQNFGKTPRQYIIDARINKAKQFLADGIYKVNVIAEQSGFSNPYHFCRVFKEKTGLTPTEYMEKNRIYKI